MESTTKGNDLRFIEPKTVIHYTKDGILSARNAANQNDNNDNNDGLTLSAGVSAYSPLQIGANLSSMTSSSHPSSNDRNLSNAEPRAVVSSESDAEIQKVHAAVHHLDLARTPHPCTRMRAMAGSDFGNQPINEKEIGKGSSTSSPSYSRSTVSSRAHSSEKKSSSRHSKTPFASRERPSKISSHHSKSPDASQHSKLPASSHARSSDKKSLSHHSKPVSSPSHLPYHERPSRRERSSRQSIALARRIQSGKKEAKAQKEKEETVVVFNVRKRVLVDLLKSLYDQPDDTILAIRVKKDQLRTLSEHEASKERRRQRRQGE